MAARVAIGQKALTDVGMAPSLPAIPNENLSVLRGVLPAPSSIVTDRFIMFFIASDCAAHKSRRASFLFLHRSRRHGQSPGRAFVFLFQLNREFVES
ncbi:hypothetical protein [Ramlibacter henchirensis]|uniref:hypothetical protein n=1 Tax=Ramlibacter henchirensis TaxID=204072 RepID=UPI00107685FB|nr:hypothetical protein [Ramlibacter henchirensis]